MQKPFPSGPRRWFSTPLSKVVARLPQPVKNVKLIGNWWTSGYVTYRAADGVLYKVRMSGCEWTPVRAAEHSGDLSCFIDGGDDAEAVAA